ncbi:outer membrane protein transport protein [Thiobacillus sp. 65-1402]|uniref:OmpP1/FadL family transporter n=1 Tax=Thiobacillus sp. 65-1402 TaxID=1895861 RepID=UPI00092A5F2A|nr:outer membrane protein transport protein [Thiobacillus sp. 65-1402]OJW42533.1 MAG: long-chain fatty acid ABC transporter [Thiobacillus sp. 65-1059]OJW76514.1 MAG: long-chain fatty acid ABC transporter [Thiobacillus sp. 65-1402]
MNKKIVAAAVSTALFALTHHAHATNGDQMFAMSAAQAGMGGATVAQAQDAATVLVNPAGMAGLGIKDVRMDLGFGLLNPPREVNGNKSDSNWYMMPAGAAVFNVNDRLFLGMGLGGISGMGVNVSDIVAAPNSQPVVTTKQVFRFSPAAAYKVNDAFTLGASLNVVSQSLAMSMAAMTNPGPPPVFTQVNLPQNQQFGFGATLGATYTINPKLQAGFTWVSKTEISEMEYHTPTGTTRFDMDMPASVAFGLAFKPMPGLLVEVDIKRIFFSDVMQSISVSNPPPGFPNPIRFGWDDQTVYAIGVKKEMGPMAVSVGYNYGKSPIGPEDVNFNLGSTAIVEHHLSFGLTRKFSSKVSGSFAYTHAFENDMTASVGPANTIKINQNQYNVNISYAF